MIELTVQQHAALESGVTRARDVVTNETYVLVREEVYERLSAIVAEDAAAAVNEIMADDDAADPLLASYQHFAKDHP